MRNFIQINNNISIHFIDNELVIKNGFTKIFHTNEINSVGYRNHIFILNGIEFTFNNFNFLNFSRINNFLRNNLGEKNEITVSI